ncbi:MAG: copper chaperone Copz family protein [Candidatus Omnitrophica bacterium]|nr:copper chaperone Copz family protein [Candidatus Omnitrophota bacterium]
MSGDCCSKPQDSPENPSDVMTEACCELHPPQKCSSAKCPECGALGKTVRKITLGALLKPESRPRIPTQDEFCFCRTPTCDVVYFRPNEVLFRKDDLTVPVGLKEPDDPNAPVCYCYGWTPEKIRSEIKETGKSTAIDQIKAQVKAGNCYCEVTNPQGSCCLGNVSQAVKQVFMKK